MNRRFGFPWIWGLATAAIATIVGVIAYHAGQTATVVTTTVPHGLATNDIILIAGNTGSNATLNGERTVTVISTTTFSVPVNCTVADRGPFIAGRIIDLDRSVFLGIAESPGQGVVQVRIEW